MSGQTPIPIVCVKTFLLNKSAYCSSFLGWNHLLNGVIVKYMHTYISQDPPRMNSEDLEEFRKPSVIKVGQNVAFKVSFEGREPLKIQWFIEDEEVLDDTNIKIEKSSTHTRLLLTKCQRKISGEVKLKIKNEFGTIEAVTQLNILGSACKYIQIKLI